MPKQILEINPFHGGLNTGTDARDIKVEELADAQDVMVDRLGRIRTMGGTLAQGAASFTDATREDDITSGTTIIMDGANTGILAGMGVSGTGLGSGAYVVSVADSAADPQVFVVSSRTGTVTGGSTLTFSAPPVDINPGYGLFHFAHDRIYGHLGEHLDEGTFTSHDNWDVSGDVSDSSVAGQLTFTWNSGAGTLEGTAQQVAADRLEAGIGGKEYVFTYTVAVTTAPDDFTLTLENFPSASTSLPFTAGTHAVVFTSHANCATAAFTITGTDDVGGTTSQGVFSIDNVSLVLYDVAETGDDYLVLADNESTDPALYIYSRASDLWSRQIITIGDTNDFAPSFYYVDGVLRVSDSNFGLANPNLWYGYIDRNLFPNINDGARISQWHSTNQSLPKPSSCYFDKVAPTVSDGETMTRYPGTTAASGTISVEYDNGGGNPLDGWENVYRVYVKVKAINSAILGGGSYSYDLTIQDHASSPVHSETIREPSGSGTHAISKGVTVEHEYTFYFDASSEEIDINTGGETLNVDITNISTSNSTLIELDTVTAWEGVYASTAHTALSNENVWLSFNSTSSITGSGWNESWHVGVSFVVDGNQESKIVVAEDASGSGSIILSGLTAAKAAQCSIYFEWTRLWDKRITGINWYLRQLDSTGNILSTWYKQGNINFITGKVRTSSGIFEELRIDISTTEYLAFIAGNLYTSPFLIESYSTSSGISEDDISIHSKYKTAVVANRMTYIGNLEIQYDDGTKEVKGDAMIKSPVNKFDVFPLSRLIEASVNDGDEIVKLEEYADRILQFKKNKMHLINVSQEIEFLEDTFMHKGVSHPGSVCKTDFGIAWVNAHGVYLYDGQKVNNLMEKNGVQIISEEDWYAFRAIVKVSYAGYGALMDDSFQIGYYPRKRQLIIYDNSSSSSSGNPRMYLYDIVTQSWVKGSNDSTNRIIDAVKTNFINDWRGDLVYAHGYGEMLRWSDTSIAGTSSLKFRTKDLDFGQPAQRKKLYKVYISYKGNGTSVNVRYAVDGETHSADMYQFNSTTTPLADKSSDENLEQWHIAELSPTTSSQATNIYSAAVHIDGAAGATFEINDINVVFRMKNIK